MWVSPGRLALLATLFAAGLAGGAALAAAPPATAPSAAAKPGLQYNLHYRAAGDTRYLPDDDYRDALALLGRDFTVTVSRDAPSGNGLAQVKLLILANPNDKAVGAHPRPPHLSRDHAAVLDRFLREGGGVLFLSNAPGSDHNAEFADTNAFLARYGIQQENAALPIKLLRLEGEFGILHNLRLAFYGGCALRVEAGHPARPRVLATNDPDQRPYRDKDAARDVRAAMIAVAEAGKGRIAVVDASSWITGSALGEAGIGGISLRPHDNAEILRRLARWTAGFAYPEAPSGK